MRINLFIQELNEYGEEVWRSSLRTDLHPDVRDVKRKESGSKTRKVGAQEKSLKGWNNQRAIE